MGLFGTDGVRGMVNRELKGSDAYAVGLAVATLLPTKSRVVIGRDTRVSGPMLEAAVASGLMAGGVEVASVGIAPTPAIAALVPLLSGQAGISISASHNPPEYNGLKLMDTDGRKWPEGREAEVEAIIDRGDMRLASPTDVGTWRLWQDALERYRSWLVGLFAGQIPTLKVVVDIGHGAATTTVVQVLESLGVQCFPIYAEPHGLLINRACGAMHPEVVANAVQRYGANVGFSFDGDADRLMAADEDGNILDGDAILYVLARGLRQRGHLPANRVVATVMSNLGLERALKTHDIVLDRTPVGDRWVAQRMAETGAAIGGEQSGHVILAQWGVTGDGLLTALGLLAEMQRQALPLSALTEGFFRYPQVLKNVRLTRGGEDWQHWPGINDELAACRTALGDDGRLLIRASGTEPLLRIMLEGRDVDQIHHWADRLVAVFERTLESATESFTQAPK